jgi:hypothetical protein
MDTKKIGLWSFFIGMVLAVATVFVTLGDWVSQVLIILGILAGFFHHKLKDDLISLGILYLVLVSVAGSMGDLVAIGTYVSDIAAAWVGFLGPVVLIDFIFWGSSALFANKEG